MVKKWRIGIIVTAVLSLFLNFAFIYYDTIPFLWPKLEKKYFMDKTIKINEKTEQIIAAKSFEMVVSKHVTMVWGDANGLTRKFFDLRYEISSEDFKKFNYPRAFLFYGLAKYYESKNDIGKLKELKSVFDSYLDKKGKPLFVFDKIDQVTFGLTAFVLYKHYNEEKYLKLINQIFNFIQESTIDNDLINYRNGQSVFLNDMLGMVVPFLIEYQKHYKNANAIEIAKTQLEYYINYGVDKETYLPTHGIDLKTGIKVGPTNWGRGIGWYFLALAEYHKTTGEFQEEYDGIINTLLRIRNPEGLWSQFPGSMDYFDASSTLLFMYGMNLNKEIYKESKDITSLLKDYLSEDGSINQTSGDTYGINDYSKTFGKSELSQGVLLMLLSMIYENNKS